MATLEYSNFRPKSLLSTEREIWTKLGKICIGTQNTESLKEALLNTSLPSKLKIQNPSLRVQVYQKGMNAVVFKNNPYVDEFQRIPAQMFGDGVITGSHHVIHFKESVLGLKINPNPKPELYLSSKEKIKIQTLLDEKLLPGNENKPLCILHVWKSNENSIAPVEFWDSLVSRWNHKYRFWQVGFENDSAVQGCEYYFLQKRSPSKVRHLFALIQKAQAFIGIDSSPMHIARAFNIPSLIYLNPLAQLSRERYHYHTPFHYYGQASQGIEKADDFFESLLK